MFSIFKREKSNNTVLKIYRVVSRKEAFDYDTGKLIDTILSLCAKELGTVPNDFYITGPYPDKGWKTKDGFLRAVKRQKYEGICHLIISNTVFSFSFQNWLINQTPSSDYDYQEIEFHANEQVCGIERMESVFEILSSVFKPDYAILFELPTNFLPATESKINNSLGSLSVAKSAREEQWQRHKIHVKNAIIKDV